MQNTGIIWTEETWNPFSGCEKITSGCKFCYAETIALKFKKAFPNGFDYTERAHKLLEPLRRKAPTIFFVNSMSDMYWSKVRPAYRDQTIQVMRDTLERGHQYQVLTKRPRMQMRYSHEVELPANYWAGTTVEDNDNMLQRLPFLLDTRASIKFLSIEPLLGPIDYNVSLKGIDWVITGGESGSHLWDTETCNERALVRYDQKEKKWLPKPECEDWIRTIRDMCLRDGVKFFHKQWGGSHPEAAGRELDGRTWNEMPRYAGDKTEIDNNYLKLIEARRITNTPTTDLFSNSIIETTEA